MYTIYTICTHIHRKCLWKTSRCTNIQYRLHSNPCSFFPYFFFFYNYYQYSTLVERAHFLIVANDAHMHYFMHIHVPTRQGQVVCMEIKNWLTRLSEVKKRYTFYCTVIIIIGLLHSDSIISEIVKRWDVRVGIQATDR